MKKIDIQFSKNAEKRIDCTRFSEDGLKKFIEEKKEAIVETSKNEFDDGEFFIRMKDEEFFLYGFVKEKENLLEIYIDEIFTQEHVL